MIQKWCLQTSIKKTNLSRITTYSKVDSFHTSTLRQILGKRKGEISNKQSLKVTGMEYVSDLLAQTRLRWAGHVRRMPDNRLPKKVMFGELIGGKNRRGRPRANWRSEVDKDCEKRDIKNWIVMSKSRSEWRKLISSPPYRS